MQESSLIPYRANTEVTPGSALVFAPHPDDEVLGCGGAIIRHVRQGDPVRVVIITNGDFFGTESRNSAQYGALRMQESQRAAEILGYGKPVFLGFPDRGLLPDEQLIGQLLKIVEDCAPHSIYLPAETEIHPDHRAVNAAGREAAKRYARDVALVFYEIGQPLKPNFLHDITDIQPVLEKAMDCFASQHRTQDYKRQITALHAYRTYTLGAGVEFAEGYFIMRSSKLKPGDAAWQHKPGFKEQAGPRTSTGNTRPLVSVIVRTMNRPELADALQSIAAQDYPNLEVIVVDAAGYHGLSLGNCCGKFPVRVVSRQHPLSRPQAANAGLNAIRGQYFGFLDEDDLLLPGHVSNLVRALSASSAPAAYDIIEQVSQTMACEYRYAQGFDYLRLVWGNYIPNLAVLFDAAIIEKGCMFDTAFDYYEDWDFLLQAARLGDFIFVPEKGGLYRNFGYSGIQHDRQTISHYREQLYLKWVPTIPADRLRGLAHAQTTIMTGADSSAVTARLCYDASTGTSYATGRQGVVTGIPALLAMPLRGVKQRYIRYRNLSLIKQSSLFDAQYYLQQNPDVRASGIDPARHYLLFGGFEGRNPSRRFDTHLYRYQNPEVCTLGMNPLIHYLKYGRGQD